MWKPYKYSFTFSLDKTLILKKIKFLKRKKKKEINTEEKKRFLQFSLDSDGEHACRVVAMVTVTSSRAKGRCGWRGFSPSLWLLNKLIETSPKALSLFRPFPLENRQSTFAVINELPDFRIPMIIK